MFNSIPQLLILMPLLPLAATIVTALLGKKWLREKSHWPILVSFVAAFLVSLKLLSLVSAASHDLKPGESFSQTVTLWTWVDVDDAIGAGKNEHNFDVAVKLRADPLTCA